MKMQNEHVLLYKGYCNIFTMEMYPVMIVLILILLRLLLKRRQLRRLPKRNAVKRKLWVREIFQKRYQQGDFHNLVKELRLGDREFYFR